MPEYPVPSERAARTETLADPELPTARNGGGGAPELPGGGVAGIAASAVGSTPPLANGDCGDSENPPAPLPNSSDSVLVPELATTTLPAFAPLGPVAGRFPRK